MPSHRIFGLVACCVVACCVFAATPARAWSTKEHILLTRLAAIRLLEKPETPPEMKAWLREGLAGWPTDTAAQRDFLLHARLGPFPRGADGLAYWTVAPDLQALTESGLPPDRVKKVEPFGVGERALHFIDLEYFNADEARRRYRPDGSNKPGREDIPRDRNDPRYQRAGMLPFRVEQCQEKLVAALRAGRLNDAPGQFPRDEHAMKWAGYLAHYVQDNTQPHHSTEDYKSASYFSGNPRSAPNIHADMEYRLVDDEFADYPDLRAEFWDLLVKALEEAHDPIETDDPFDATVEVALRSYDALPLIGEAAMAAYEGEGAGRKVFDAGTFYRFKGKVDGRDTSLLEMKARQMAWAVRRTQRLWLLAWRQATTPEG
jgi:hypothetical protein